MRFAKYINIEAVTKYFDKFKDRLKMYSIKDLMLTGTGKTRPLLSTASKKFDMQNGTNIATKGIYLSPFDEIYRVTGIKGLGSCSGADKECPSTCLIWGYHLNQVANINARVKKTLYLHAYPMDFLNQIIGEIFAFDDASYALGEYLQVRFNGTSDFPFEEWIHMDLLIQDSRSLKAFYDYSKILSRKSSAYYSVTYSVNGRSKPKTTLEKLLQGSIAVVVDNASYKKLLALDSEFIINGDKSDHRPQDPICTVVILRYKKYQGIDSSDIVSFVKDFDYVNDLIENNRKALLDMRGS
tara:strand:- start:158 stop:1048 length:891 start_codon:yes stop_codon:yes gene_type:complete